MVAHLRRLGALLLCFAVGCTRSDALGSSAAQSHPHPMPARPELPVEGDEPSFDAATTWLNSRPLSTSSLHGKVVLVQFWTYSCINWRRTLPYVRAWSLKYASAGLVVIGVHSPEFDFEKEVGNVQKATRDANIGFPVAVDNEHAIWNAFGNEYWPALYFVDAHGRIRHRQFGEGEYEHSERIIQELLVEAGASALPPVSTSVPTSGTEVPASWADLRSQENYLGYRRTENFSSPVGAFPGERQVYPTPAPLELNHWALTGDWLMDPGAVTLNRASGRVAYRFHARDLHLVMRAATPGATVRFRVRLDGQPPMDAHGDDVDAQGNGMVSEPRLYQLIRQPQPIVDRDFEIEFFDAPVEAFSFTFG